MTQEELKQKINDLIEEIRTLSLDSGVRYHTALYAYLFTAYFALDQVDSHINEFEEENSNILVNNTKQIQA